MNFRLIPFAAALAVLPLNFALAQSSCNEVVVDQAHVISDVGKVEAAAKSLGNQGATVRVRTFDKLPPDSLNKAIEQLRDSCPSWHNGNRFASTMLVLAYAPDGHQVGARFGTSLESRLGSGTWNRVLVDRLVPQIKASARGDKGAITVGMVDTLHEMQATLARSSAGGAVTINQAADYSGLWKAFGWLVAFAGIGFIGFLVWSIWFRTRGDKEQHESARALARRARNQAVSGLLDITNETTMASATAQILGQPAEKQAGLNAKLERVKALSQQGLSTLSSFDSTSGEDPNTNLSVDAYRSNQARYEEIMREYVQPAKRLLAQIEIGDSTGSATPRDPTPPPQPEPQSRPHFLPENAQAQAEAEERRREEQARARAAYRASWPDRRPPPPEPQPQVVERVVERGGSGTSDMLTGIVVGDMLSRGRDDSRRRDRDYDDGVREGRRERDYSDRGGYSPRAEPREEPPKSDSGGAFSVSVDKSEDTGGSIAVDTSSDDSDSGGSVAVDTSSDDNNA